VRGAQFRRLGVATLVVLGLLLGCFSTGAPAATFAVDDTADAPDSVPGDGSCNNGVGECTLRAAVEEANALAGADAVTLLANTYGLQVSDGGAI
jgi:CSLREA domain-containing protein